MVYYRRFIFALFFIVAGHVSPLIAQTEEVRLDPPQTKITTVSAMRVRKAPQVTADEIQRLKLGTVVQVNARSASKDTIGGKTDYWYRLNVLNGESGWLFGGLLLDYDRGHWQQPLRDIIEGRLKAENTDFADREELYRLAEGAIKESKDVNTRAEFELFKLLALANWAAVVSDDNQAHREWRKAHASEVVGNEFAGGYNLRSDVLWALEAKYHALPIADRIAWEAAQNMEPSDCEGDEVCGFFVGSGAIKYLSLHPQGKHASEALHNLTEDLTDEVIKAANATGGDKYEVEQRTELRKLLTSLRTALPRTTAPEKGELVKKLQRIKF